MRLLEGEIGKWAAREWSPAYAMILVVIPLLAWVKTPPETFTDAALHALGAGDVLAVSFCLLFSATPLLARTEAGYQDGQPESYAPELQMFWVAFGVLIGYVGIKLKPMDGDTLLGVYYTVYSVFAAVASTIVVYRLKLRVL
jgi:hypothetical protein